MRKILGLAILLVLITALMTVTGCSSTDKEDTTANAACSASETTTDVNVNAYPDVKWEEGLITYNNLEGGFYVITTSDNQRYEPINLSSYFQKDGFDVLFKAKKLDTVSGHDRGTPVEILSMTLTT